MNRDYDQTIGYGSIESIDVASMLRVIRAAKNIIEDHITYDNSQIILVGGAGIGIEAELIYQEFNRKTIGVDLHIAKIGLDLDDRLHFIRLDLSSLAFREDTFSIIYCFHVLEHVENYIEVLSEFNRVMRNDGVLFVGFPNKNRIGSYYHISQKASVLERVLWNINDYKHRIQGRFENRYGAHAGFTQFEFMMASSEIFTSVYPVRTEYMYKKYAKYKGFIRLIISLKLDEFIFPSNYFICLKKRITEKLF